MPILHSNKIMQQLVRSGTVQKTQRPGTSRRKTERSAAADAEPLSPMELLCALDEAISLVVCAKVATDVVTMDRDPLISSGNVGEVLARACIALRAVYNQVGRAHETAECASSSVRPNRPRRCAARQ